MDVRNKLLIGIVAMLPTSLMADSFLTEADVTYRGNQSAMQVCRAVVNDDVESLAHQLERVKNDALASYRFDATSDAVVRSVACNGMELLTFADHIGARSISNYLGEGRVIIEEVVVVGQR